MSEVEKQYVTKVMDINQKGTEFIDEHNKWLMDYDMKVRQEQRQEDNMMMNAYGVMYKNGAPLMDQSGNVIPTLDRIKFSNQVDQQLSTQTGYLYMDGRMVMDQGGNPVETFGGRCPS